MDCKLGFLLTLTKTKMSYGKLEQFISFVTLSCNAILPAISDPPLYCSRT